VEAIASGVDNIAGWKTSQEWKEQPKVSSDSPMWEDYRADQMKAMNELHGDKGNKKASLAKASHYFRQVIKPRRIRDDSGFGEAGEGYRLCLPGEKGGEPFPIYGTKVGQLYSWGPGIGMYFGLLGAMGWVMLTVGLIQFANMAYYNSDKYIVEGTSVGFHLIGSALCNVQTQVELLDGSLVDRFECPFAPQQAYVVIISMFTFVIGLVAVNWKIVKHRRKTDDRHPTALSYSVCVHSPEKDAVDPDEWADFFSRWGDVAAVTIALNNGKLMNALADQMHIHEMITSFENGYRPVFELNWLPNGIRQRLQPFGVCKDAEFWRKAALEVKVKLHERVVQKYLPNKIFVSFNRELDRRNCLRDLKCGSVSAYLDLAKIPMQHKFRGIHVVHCTSPVEPEYVIWNNLGMFTRRGTFTRDVLCYVLCGTVVAISVLLVTLIAEQSSSGLGGAFGLQVGNRLIMYVCGSIIDSLERPWESRKRRVSRMTKIALSQVLHTMAVFITVTDYSLTLSEETLHRIALILIVHGATGPVLEVLQVRDSS
jgi:hypothetical protein